MPSGKKGELSCLVYPCLFPRLGPGLCFLCLRLAPTWLASIGAPHRCGHSLTWCNPDPIFRLQPEEIQSDAARAVFTNAVFAGENAAELVEVLSKRAYEAIQEVSGGTGPGLLPSPCLSSSSSRKPTLPRGLCPPQARQSKEGD